MPTFTKEQQEAIDREGENILVSAGAGSGKTAVLTERVLRKVKTNTSIDRLLILTFTKKAAAEMKERIRKKLAKEGLQDNLELIDSSYITTFDSFSMAVVRKYADMIGVSREIGIIENTLFVLKEKEVLNEILNTYYEREEESFTKLIQAFCLKDDNVLREKILSLYHSFDLILDKEDFYTNYLTTYYQEENLKQYVVEYVSMIKEKKEELLCLCNDFLSLQEEDTYQKTEAVLQPFLSSNTYDEMKKTIKFSLPRLKNGSSDEVKELKKKIGEEQKKFQKFFSYESEEEMLMALKESKEMVSVLLQIVKELDDKLYEYKQQKNAYTFMDIEKMAISLVRDNIEVREELRDQFDEILIDEYQDTNDIQEAFISYIASNNVYMVGDIKQSIYRFRNANPYLFEEKYDRYKKNDGGSVIDLSKNFRSRKEVLDEINKLFSLIMDKRLGGAEYQEGHAMIFGNEMYLNEGKTEEDYLLDIITYEAKSEDEMEKQEKEAFLIGNDIKEKLDRGLLIFDKEEEVLRKASYRDFVIIMDRSTDFTLYKQVFEFLGIPLTVWKNDSSRTELDLELIKNMFVLSYHIYKKQYDDAFVFSFVSLARSFLYEMTDEEIYHVIEEKTYQDTKLYQDFLEIVEEYEIASPTIFFDTMIRKTEYREKLIKIGKVHAFRSRLTYFSSLVKNLEEMGMTIAEMKDYFSVLCESKLDIELAISREDGDSVKIMSIHTSKGLEYPICYFGGFAREFNTKDYKETVFYDKTYGLIIPDIEREDNLITRNLALQKLRENDISEKIRLFYVALTRAREKMIIVMPDMGNISEKEETNFVSINTRLHYYSFERIMQSVCFAFSDRIRKVEKIKNLSKDYLKGKKKTREEVKQEHLEMIPSCYQKEERKKETFSKVSLQKITKEEKELLEYGSYVHDLLEQCNLKDKTMPQIEDKKIKEKIKKFLESDFLKLYEGCKVFQEYEFIEDTKDGEKHGKIDLLLVGDAFAIIVDYKLKNTLDMAYKKQLAGYKEVIEKKLKKPVLCYLYSILEETFTAISC